MATVVNFHGKKYIEPGAYAVSVYNPTSVVNVSQFGNVMIIDTGLSQTSANYTAPGGGQNCYEFSGGSGVNGELSQGLKSVYEFENYEDFLAFIGGGQIGDIAQKIFEPRPGVLGAPKLYYTRAAATTAAKMVLTLKTGVTLTLTCKNEGFTGNAVVSDGTLKLGYAAKIVAGTDDNSKFKLQVYQGSFMGSDAAGEPYGAKDWYNAPQYLLVESPELSTIKELVDWCKGSQAVLANFKVETSGTIDTSALTAVAQVNAAGGTTDYTDATAFANVLEAIEELDVTFFLCCNSSVADATNPATNGKLFTFIKNTAKFTEFMVIPGGVGSSDLLNTSTVSSGTSEAVAKYYDSEQVVVVHGSPVVSRKDGNGTKELPSIYLAATVVGMAAGSAPQVPLTFKRVGYDAFKYDLKHREREKALQAGILHVRNVNGYWVVNQGITTLQDNQRTYANDGQSLEFSIALIKAQLNKELIIDASDRFTGGNVGSVSPATVKNFVETKLQSLTVVGDTDNLIVDWKNVKVVAKNTDFYCTYDFVPNVPLNKVFFTGNVLDFSVTL